MTSRGHRLPDGSIPVLLSGETPEMVRDDAAAVLAYAADHPEVGPQRISDMMMRTRSARRHRALAMVTDGDGLVSALKAVVDGGKHPCLIRPGGPVTARRIAYVFPGQGGQRPGMGRLFYDSTPAFRDEADRCAAEFESLSGVSPLNYLLDEDFPDDHTASTVQPALFTQMAAMAAMWRSVGISPSATVGHSQGEIAAAYVSRAVTLTDAALVVGIRARAADRFESARYAMAVVATDRDTCEDVLARCPGWAQLSVVNSPNLIGISGDRESVQGIVDTFGHRGTFARVIDVGYPAHTHLMHDLSGEVRDEMRRRLHNPTFLETEIDCIGATLGDVLTSELPGDQYWSWNLRNTVRFDRAISAARRRDIDTFVELADHPTLQLAIRENLAYCNLSAATVVGTSERTATDLQAFTRNLALLAVQDLDYRWECLRTENDGLPISVSLPLADFPNTPMQQTRLWLPYYFDPPPLDPARPESQASTAGRVDAPSGPTGAPTAESAPARLLREEWIRLSRRSLAPPGAIGFVDHTGQCADLARSLRAAAEEFGATACVVDVTAESGRPRPDGLDTLVILVPPSQESQQAQETTAVDRVATFFGDRTWWPKEPATASECWLVTVGGEAAVAGDAPPDPVHAAACAGFRCLGAEHPAVRFRHLDLPAATATPESPGAILKALQTAGETDLALRNGALYAKRIVEAQSLALADGSDTAHPQHVLIVGGTGKLGLEFCQHFARLGPRRITLVSRSGETSATSDRLQQLRATTAADLRVRTCDVGDPTAVSQLARELRDVPADLIVHAAVEYADAELADLTVERVGKVLRAKVIGIRNILAACPRTPDCRVLLCSSTAATIGGRGQVAYAAANRMLDAMADGLRARGVDCTAVQWGQWTTHFDLDAAGLAKLAVTGVVPMSPDDALRLGLSRFDSNVIVAGYDLDRARSVLEPYGYGPLLSQLTTPVPNATVAVAAPQATAQAGVQPQSGDPSRRFLKLLAETIGAASADAVDVGVPMVAIGLDSLQALEFRRRVKAELDHELDVAELLGGASIADVLSRLDASAANASR